MAETTSNYGLHQWTVRDGIRREELNQDFQAIDTVLAEKDSQFSAASTAILLLQKRLQAQRGQYMGTGSTSRTISLGFQPKAIFVEAQHGMREKGYGGLATNEAACINGGALIEVTSTGFTVHSSGTTIQTNNKDVRYFYLAFY